MQLAAAELSKLGAACQIWLNLLYSNQDMMDEYTKNGMVFWGGYMCPGYQFYSSKEITDTTPSAFNGLTVMCDNAEMQSFINGNKGGAISVFPPDYLSNLQNGVADALVQHVNCAYVFGCFDYVKTAVFFGEGGFYNLPLAIVSLRLSGINCLRIFRISLQSMRPSSAMRVTPPIMACTAT